MASDGLSRWLVELDDARLTALVRVRLGRVQRPPASFDQLAALLSQVQACHVGLQLLDRTAAQVVALVAEGGGRTTPAALAGRLGVEPAHVRGALERAAAYALAWPAADGTWRTPGGLAHVVRGVLGRSAPYEDLLDGMDMQDLRALLAAHGLGGSRSAAAARQVLQLALPGRVDSSLAALAGAHDALRHVAIAGELPDDRALAEELLRCGLLLQVDGRLFLPAEVEQRVRGARAVLHVEEPPARQDVAPAAPPVDPALRLLTCATRLLGVLGAEPPKALVSGGLGVQVLRRLAKAVEQDLEDVVLLLQLLAAARLVATGSEAGTVTARGRAWSSLPEELAYVQLVRPQLHPGAVLEAPESSPSGVLLGVARSGRDRPGVRRLAQAAAARGPESDASLVLWLDWSSWRPQARATRVRSYAQSLHVLELLALRVAGTPAPWLEALLAVDQPGSAPGLGSDDDEDDADAQAAPAAALLAAHLPPSQDDVVLQADGTAIVAGRAGAELRALLDVLGARESDHSWRLSSSGVRDALDAGRTGDDLLAELTARARHGVPAVIERMVRDAAAAHGRVEVRAVRTVLRLADVVLGVELLHDRRLRGLGLVEVAPGVVASSKPPAQVVAALRAAGHAPVGDGATAPKPKAAARRASRPAAPAWSWGHSAEEVVAQLRRGPAASPELATARRAGALHEQQVLDELWPRLRHLSGDEAMLLVAAVAHGEPVEIDYVDSGGSPSTRVVEDLEDTGHLLVGHCRLRDDERMFAPVGILGVRPAS